jgi:hypothetical protein
MSGESGRRSDPVCPRRVEQGRDHGSENDEFLGDETCSYCGSISGDYFMRRLEAGDVSLDPTDKNYKVYVRNKEGQPFRQTYRTDSKPFVGWHSPEHDWVTREIQETKFYFQHLSKDQMIRFVELLNQKKLTIGEPGHFYRMPYFVSQ